MTGQPRRLLGVASWMFLAGCVQLDGLALPDLGGGRATRTLALFDIPDTRVPGDVRGEVYDLARTRLRQLTVVVSLYRALGGGWSSSEAPPIVPSPLAP